MGPPRAGVAHKLSRTTLAVKTFLKGHTGMSVLDNQTVKHISTWGAQFPPQTDNG